MIKLNIKNPYTMKKIIMTIAIATMMAVPASAQIFMDDDDINNRDATDPVEPGAIIPEQNVTYDQYEPYVPVGEGALLLAGLAGAYLIGKRRKEE